MRIIKRGTIERLPDGRLFITGWNIDFEKRPVDISEIEKFFESEYAKAKTLPHD